MTTDAAIIAAWLIAASVALAGLWLGVTAAIVAGAHAIRSLTTRPTGTHRRPR